MRIRIIIHPSIYYLLLHIPADRDMRLQPCRRADTQRQRIKCTPQNNSPTVCSKMCVFRQRGSSTVTLTATLLLHHTTQLTDTSIQRRSHLCSWQKLRTQPNMSSSDLSHYTCVDMFYIYAYINMLYLWRLCFKRNPRTHRRYFNIILAASKRMLRTNQEVAI